MQSLKNFYLMRNTEGGVIGIIEIPGLDIRCPVMEGTMRFVVRCIYKEVVMDE